MPAPVRADRFILASPASRRTRETPWPGAWWHERIRAGPCDSPGAWRDWHALDGAGTTWISLGRFVGTFGGLVVLLLVTEQQLSLLVGISTVLAVLTTLLAPSFQPGRGAFVAAGLVTGVTETSTGVGGPPLAPVYQHQPAPVLRSSVAACFLIGEVISLVVLAVTTRADRVRLRAAALGRTAEAERRSSQGPAWPNALSPPGGMSAMVGRLGLRRRSRPTARSFRAPAAAATGQRRGARSRG